MAANLHLTLLLLLAFLFITHPVKCDNDDGADPEDLLLQGINIYRASLNLPALTKNQNAECFADEIAEQFRSKVCSNSTGSNTVPGNEPQFANYPTLLSKCRLNVSNTRDGSIMPSCVPNLDKSLVLSNFTKSQYSGMLNDTKYTGIGIGSENSWIVVVLTTNTSEGSFAAATQNAAGLVTNTAISTYLSLLMALFLVYI